MKRTYLVQRLAVSRDRVINLLLSFIQILLQTLNLRCETLESPNRRIPRLHFLPFGSQSSEKRIERSVNRRRLCLSIRCESLKFRELLQCRVHAAFVVNRCRLFMELERQSRAEGWVGTIARSRVLKRTLQNLRLQLHNIEECPGLSLATS
jgi:hypothetical protein